VQQPDTEDLLQGDEVPGHGGQGDTEFDGCIGERSCVHDRDQAAQVPQLEIHNHSV